MIMSNTSKVKILFVLGVFVVFVYVGRLFSPTIYSSYWEQQDTNYHGKHGQVIAVNNVFFKGKDKEQTQTFAMLRIGEDKVYGEIEGYNGFEVRTNEPNKRYFIRIISHQVDGEDVVERKTLLVYLDKEDWELFSPIHKEHFITEKK